MINTLASCLPVSFSFLRPCDATHPVRFLKSHFPVSFSFLRPCDATHPVRFLKSHCLLFLSATSVTVRVLRTRFWFPKSCYENWFQKLNPGSMKLQFDADENWFQILKSHWFPVTFSSMFRQRAMLQKLNPGFQKTQSPVSFGYSVTVKCSAPWFPVSQNPVSTTGSRFSILVPRNFSSCDENWFQNLNPGFQ